MANQNPAGPRVSLRRVLLLLLFGASACMAMTEPGRWMAWQLLPRPWELAWARSHLPPRLESAPVDAAFTGRVEASFQDLSLGGGESAAHLAPADERILERLAGLEHWTDCVVFECGTRPADLQVHGWSDLETCEAITQADWVSTPEERATYAEMAWREWVLLLLDAQGRCLARTPLRALRPRSRMCNDDSSPWAVQPDTSGTEALAAIRSFHRGADGAIVMR